jgi:hypothetical protein
VSLGGGANFEKIDSSRPNGFAVGNEEVPTGVPAR